MISVKNIRKWPRVMGEEYYQILQHRVCQRLGEATHEPSEVAHGTEDEGHRTGCSLKYGHMIDVHPNKGGQPQGCHQLGIPNKGGARKKKAVAKAELSRAKVERHEMWLAEERTREACLTFKSRTTHCFSVCPFSLFSLYPWTQSQNH